MVQAGAEEFIWIVVGIFWVIAQVAGGALKKKMPAARPVTDEDGEPEENPPVLSHVEGLTDLMRKLGVAQEIKAPAPQKPAAPRKGEMHLAPTPAKKTTPTPKAPVIAEIAEVDIRPTMNSFKSAMPSMKLPSMKMSFQPSEKSARNVPSLGSIINPRDKSTLRRAMLSHIVLGKPRGLGSRDWNEGMLE